MHRQDILDTVADHLITQKVAAVLDSSCRYRYEGNKCAVGALIPDELYTIDMEQKPVGLLIDEAESLGYRLPEFINKANQDLLQALQQVHDQNYEYVTKDNVSRVMYLEFTPDFVNMKMALIAEDFGLTYTPR